VKRYRGGLRRKQATRYLGLPLGIYCIRTSRREGRPILCPETPKELLRNTLKSQQSWTKVNDYFKMSQAEMAKPISGSHFSYVSEVVPILGGIASAKYYWPRPNSTTNEVMHRANNDR
jgi:hypothetical protein